MKLKVSPWITIFGLFLFVSKIQTQSSSGWEKKTYIDIDNDFEGSGKVSNQDTVTDDEDLLVASGDDEMGSGGSGDTDETKITTVLIPTKKKMTACEQLRSSTQEFTSETYYIPECTSTGEYEVRQCEGIQGAKKCWCVNPNGVEIQNTQMTDPHVPDCHTGTNLKPCVFESMKRHRGFGALTVRCTLDGEYEKIQCHERDCWCVDKNGVEKPNTRRKESDIPVCEEPTVKPTMAPPIHILPESPDTPRPLPPDWTKQPDKDDKFDFDTDRDDVYEIEKTPPSVDVDVSIDGGKFDKDKEDNNENDKSVKSYKKPEAQSTFLQMIESPGILAAVIGGSVVGLLCAILLVMFIVYRMRKKDEGSYPLEEQKYTNYSYMKAPDKEFYA